MQVCVCRARKNTFMTLFSITVVINLSTEARPEYKCLFLHRGQTVDKNDHKIIINIAVGKWSGTLALLRLLNKTMPVHYYFELSQMKHNDEDYSQKPSRIF